MWKGTSIVAFFFVQFIMGYDYYVAEFVGPAYGTVEFHPVPEGGIQITTSLRGDLISFSHMLHIHEAVITPGANCEEAGDHVDSWSTSDSGYACNPNSPDLCHVGDISGKHGFIDLSLELEERIDMDYNLFLSNLTNRSLVLHNKRLSTERFACANLVGKMYPEYLSVNFSDTYWGAMIFRTRSDGTVGIVHKVQTHIGDSIEHRYHIHENPITLGVNGTDCYAAGPHFDPTQAEDDSLYYAPAKCTPDGDQSQCFYGDLEGKYGALALLGNTVGVSILSAQDSQLRIPAIWERSVVVHQAGGDLERILCDTLQPQEFTEAEAVFTGDVTGEMKFRMHNDGTMRISYDLRNTNFQSSNNHKIHIHVDNVLPGAGCGSAGGHYDPMVVEVAGYACDPSDVATCYYGDLSGKFGQANFPATGSWQDEQLTVSEIIGRSIVIHVSDGAPRYDCATIMPTAALPKLAVAEFDDLDGLNGYLLFREQSDGDVLILSNLVDANSVSTNLKITVTDSDTYADDCFTSGEVWNPTHHVSPSSAMGALSNRYNFRVGTQFSWIENNHNFQVPALVGGSIVISQGNERVACKSISQYPVITYAEAVFSDSNDIWGSIRFRTVEGQTMISYNLMHGDSSSAEEMSWYIHEDVSSDCHQLTEIWDPFWIGNSQSCNRNAFSTCMVGDFSSKHGDLISPAAGYTFDGSFSVSDVVGRSIVIMDAHGNRRCAIIHPKINEAQTAAAEFRQGVVIFRRASGSTSVVYSLIGTNQQGSEIFIKDSCQDQATDPFTSNVVRPSMFVETTDMKVSDLIGKFMTLDGECVEIEEVWENSKILDLDARAPFDGALTGEMEFTRLNETDRSGFSMKIMLENTDGSISQRHKFHVHNSPVVKEQGCGSAGGHFDPLVVEISGYECDANSPIATCYYGDLSGRYEMKLPFPIETTLIDSDVPLMELVGRSIVIHEKDNGGPRYDCATIFPIPRTLTRAPTSSPSPPPVSTSSTTPRPTRSPVTRPPTGATPAPPVGGEEVNDAATVTESSSGSNTGLILGILLPLLCCICIPLAYFGWRYYEERDMTDALRTKMPALDMECPDCSMCPAWCATTYRSHTTKNKKSAFHLGKYATPNNSGITLTESNDSLHQLPVHKCPHGLKTFIVNEPNWY